MKKIFLVLIAVLLFSFPVIADDELSCHSSYKIYKTTIYDETYYRIKDEGTKWFVHEGNDLNDARRYRDLLVSACISFRKMEAINEELKKAKWVEIY